MTKTVFLLLLSMWCGGLRAQDYCAFFVLPANENCADLDPKAVVDATFCEWLENDDGTRTPITGDPVLLTGQSINGSGYHPHDIPGFSPTPRPQPTLSPAKGMTNSAGCITTTVYMPAFSGSYRLRAVGQLAREMMAESHYLLKTGSDYPKPLTQTPYMVPQSTYYDGFHGGQSFWVRADVDHKYQALAHDYWIETGGRSLAAIARCSLPEGGASDNDLGPNLVSIPGQWQIGLRKRETHDVMDECDIINPSIAEGDTFLFVKVTQLQDAAAESGCGFGEYTADNTGIALFGYWETSKGIHIVCESSAPVLTGPPGSPN